MRPSSFTTLATALVLFASTPAVAQEGAAPAPGAASPGGLADAFLRAFQTGSADGGSWALLPGNVREWIDDTADIEGGRRVPGFARVAHQEGDHALLVLAGHIAYGGSAYETSLARSVSGFYEAERTGEEWRIVSSRRLGLQGRILSQALDVVLRPGEGLEVTDTVSLRVTGRGGLGMLLNHAAELASVHVGGRPVEYDFGGGLLWLDLPPGDHRVTLDYAIDVARDSAAHPNSGHFTAEYGHVRNQYFWHPFFDFSSEEQLGHFTIRVRAPEGVRVATDLPQTETSTDGVRTVRGRTREPTYALSLFYDAEWEPTIQEVEGFSLARFATPGTPPSDERLSRVFQRTYTLLSRHFGAPEAGYLAAVQVRAREGSGWLFRTNDAMAMPVDGGSSMWRDDHLPRATFGHEVAHGWTRPTGPAANFLREGWATYAESILIHDRNGAEAERRFWEIQRLQYISRFEGRTAILDDPGNSGIAYYKGAWVLRMLREYVGPRAFEEGFAEYMGIPAGRRAGHEEFARAMSDASGSDVAAFLRPWLEETEIPLVTASIEPEAVVLEQHGPVHILPLEVELRGPGITARRRVVMDGREAVVPVPEEVTAVRVDPDGRLLLRRATGDVAHFVFDPGDTDPGSVALQGLFVDDPVPAARGDDGLWTVDLELPEGSYLYWWIADEESSGLRTMVVEGTRPVSAGTPGGPPGR